MAISSDIAIVDRRCRLLIANPVSTPNDFRTATTDVIEIKGGATGDNAPGLRVAFKAKKTLKKEPNTGEIIVTNLAPATRGSLQKKGVKVMLEAGYAGTGLTRIFSGDVRSVDHVREGADWNTTFKFGDGERAFKYAKINESFSPGTPLPDIAKKALGFMGLDPGNALEKLAGVQGKMDQGFVATGSASKALDQILTAAGLTYSIQDGKLQILEPYGDMGGNAIEISPTSGLIGSPEMGSPTKRGKPTLLKFKCLLLPITPGSLVKLVSERYDGVVQVRSCEYEGDTHGGDWYVTIEGMIKG